MTDEKLCYVIMPFSKTRTCSEAEWTEIFEEMIKPSVEGAGLNYECARSSATTGSLIKGIIESLFQASVVIADLTDRNSNVFYELGVRHTLKNRTILIAQRREHIPSDLNSYASHIYQWKTRPDRNLFSDKMRELLLTLESDLDRSDNPVNDFLADRSQSVFAIEQESRVRMLHALALEMDSLMTLFGSLVDQAFLQEPARTAVLSCPALDHFIATLYINNDKFIEQAVGLRSLLALLGFGKISEYLLRSATNAVIAFKENAKTLLKAVKAGASTEAVELKPLRDD